MFELNVLPFELRNASVYLQWLVPWSFGRRRAVYLALQIGSWIYLARTQVNTQTDPAAALYSPLAMHRMEFTKCHIELSLLQYSSHIESCGIKYEWPKPGKLLQLWRKSGHFELVRYKMIFIFSHFWIVTGFLSTSDAAAKTQFETPSRGQGAFKIRKLFLIPFLA